MPQQEFGSLNAGYEYRDQQFLVSPYGRLEALNTTFDRFSETGAGTNALTFFQQRVTTLTGIVGLRSHYIQTFAWGTVMPFNRVEFQHDFQTNGKAGLAYSDLASFGAAYWASGDPGDSNHVLLGAGSRMELQNLNLTLEYGTPLGYTGEQDNTVKLTVGLPF